MVRLTAPCAWGLVAACAQRLLLGFGVGFLAPNELEVDGREFLERRHGVVIILDPALNERPQVFGHVHLSGFAFRVAHREVVGGAVLLPLHALAARLPTLGVPLEERRPQDGAQAGESLEERSSTPRQTVGRGTRHVVTLAQMLRHCKHKTRSSDVPTGTTWCVRPGDLEASPPASRWSIPERLGAERGENENWGAASPRALLRQLVHRYR